MRNPFRKKPKNAIPAATPTPPAAPVETVEQQRARVLALLDNAVREIDQDMADNHQQRLEQIQQDYRQGWLTEAEYETAINGQLDVHTELLRQRENPAEEPVFISGLNDELIYLG